MTVRLGPISDENWPAEIKDMRTGFAGQLNVYRVMAHNPPLLAAWRDLRDHVVLKSAFIPRQRELIILRTAHRWGSSYEWAHHVVRGEFAGLGANEIEAARQDPQAWPGTAADAALISLVDALLDGTAPDVASTGLSAGQLLDAMVLVGFYTTLAFIANSFDVPLEADGPPKLAPH